MRRGGVAVAILVSLAALFYWASRPRQLTAFVLGRTGASLGLEISAEGATEYHLSGTPRVTLRGVTARQPGSTTPLLSARRIHLALPWSTLRPAGEPLVIERLELDGARIDLPALQRWQATRPPTAPRLPTITRGLRVRDGALAGEDWRIDGIDLDAPVLAADRPLQARMRARYVAPALQAPMELAIVLIQPSVLVGPGVSGFAAHGSVLLQSGDEWRMPGYLRMSGPLHRSANGMRIRPARVGLAATLESGENRVPFAIGANGSMQLHGNGIAFAPAAFVLDGRGDPTIHPVPSLTAKGEVALDTALRLHLGGRMAAWPVSWPSLPSPLGDSDAPLPFSLDYEGAASLEDRAALTVSRDATRFSARFRLPEVLAWVDSAGANGIPAAGSPLPPLSGSLETPRLELDGVTLEGVRIGIDEDAAP